MTDNAALSRAVQVCFVLKETKVTPVSYALIFPTRHAANLLYGQPGSAKGPLQDGVDLSPIELESGQLA